MKARILINSGEHSFSSDPSASVDNIEVKEVANYPLTLFDSGGKKEVFEIPNCSIIIVEGKKFKEEIIISKSLIQSLEQEKTEAETTVNVELWADREIWSAGFAEGFFFDLNDIPAALKTVELQ